MQQLTIVRYYHICLLFFPLFIRFSIIVPDDNILTRCVFKNSSIYFSSSLFNGRSIFFVSCTNETFLYYGPVKLNENSVARKMNLTTEFQKRKFALRISGGSVLLFSYFEYRIRNITKICIIDCHETVEE